MHERMKRSLEHQSIEVRCDARIACKNDTERILQVGRLNNDGMNVVLLPAVYWTFMSAEKK